MIHSYIDKMIEKNGFTNFDRPQWIGLLARAPLSLLNQAFESYTHLHCEILKPYEIVSYMVQARTGSTGQRFNVGEVTVSRMTLKLTLSKNNSTQPQNYIGVAYVRGANERQTRLAAIFDALLQDEGHHPTLVLELLEPIQKIIKHDHELANQKVRATKVDFFTVARENTATQV